MTFSIFVPTVGRSSLAVTLASIAEQALLPGDEVLLLHDGPPNPHYDGRALLKHYGLRGRAVRLMQGPHRDWGHTPKNIMRGLAGGSHCLYLDDDDHYLPGALEAMRAAAVDAPDRVHLFRGEFPGGMLWREQVLAPGDVGTPLVMHPSRIHATWPPRYGGDFDFIRGVVAASGSDPLWHEDVIVRVPHISGLS